MSGLTSVQVSMALAFGVALAFVTMWLTMRRLAAALWAVYWVSWLSNNALYLIVVQQAKGWPHTFGIDWATLTLSLTGVGIHMLAQWALLGATWLHTRPGAPLDRWRRWAHVSLALLPVAALGFASILDSHWQMAASLLAIRLVSVGFSLLACVAFVRSHTPMQRTGRRLMIAAFALVVLRVVCNCLFMVWHMAAGRPDAATDNLPPALLILQAVSAIALCLATLYLLFAEQRDSAMRLYAIKLGSERLRSLGRMAEGIGADFSRVITDVRGALVAARSAPTRNDFDAATRRILDAVSRGRERGAAMLSYARAHAPRLQRLILDDWIAAERDALTAEHATGCDVAFELTALTAAVNADPVLLRRVLGALLSNASDAQQRQGRLLVTSRVRLDTRHVVLRIVDQGPGIPTENLTRVTDPFFTTKHSDEHPGLGLALSRTFVEQCGGMLRLVPAQPRGTAAEVWLPMLN